MKISNFETEATGASLYSAEHLADQNLLSVWTLVCNMQSTILDFSPADSDVPIHDQF